MSMWNRCKHYINKHEIGTVVSRQDFLRYLYQGSPPKHSTYGTGGDNYRRSLSILGILEIVKRGHYKILYHIKPDVTATHIKELSYGDSWKQWFCDIKAKD